MEMEVGKLFIGGISWGTNEDRLREYFETFGEVVEAVIMKDRTTGRARGFGFVVFADPAIAEMVVMKEHMIDGRTVEAKKAVPREDQNILNKNNIGFLGSSGPSRTKKIFVGGLASMVTESDFKRYFDQFGTITDVVVMYDHNNQRPRGFGFITYDSEEAVDKVLQRTFHELNGKMVEVKRAVPKESSLGPSRNQLGGYNLGLGRVNSFLNGYMQGYDTNSVRGYGVRMEGRSSPGTIGQSGFSPSSPGHGMGLNFESRLSPSSGWNSNFSSNLSYGRGLNTSFNGISNRFASPFGYGVGSGLNSSVLNSADQNIWGNGSLSYATNSTNSSPIVGSRSGKTSVSPFGSIGSLWDSSPESGLGGGAASAYDNLRYGSGDFGVASGGIGHERTAQVSSHGASNGVYADFYEKCSLYGDSTWRSLPLDLEPSSSFDFGLGNTTSDVIANNSAGYIGGYTVTNRQTNEGKT
ncbi:hypothetical protein like AT3G07810 [Hibiscus trionum]|uniref:RRM domain-containing protein n=1 Tax=Hibiscus trionum TaxID=183268 RepID=A0A9W7IAA4_HIBTR|nr:hypothetical protein like AT3G07810 [Hibiscus trionum]